MRNTLTFLIFFFAGLVPMQAVVIVGSQGSSLTFTQDIEFEITGFGGISFVVFDDWVNNVDANSTSLPTPDNLVYSINGGPDQTTGIGEILDNFRNNSGDLSPQDGWLSLTTQINPFVGQTVTLKAGTYSFSGSTAFNPEAVGNFNGDIYLVGSGGSRLSAPGVPIPEPRTSAGIFGLTILVLILIRRFFR
jgi:hypothetical protein